MDDDQLASLGAELRALRNEMLAVEEQRLGRSGVHPAHAASARNLLHYLALRRRDLRPVQDRLDRLGLSSLGRCEADVLANLDSVLDVLERLQGGPAQPGRIGAATALGLGHGHSLLQRHAPEAADEPAVVSALLAAGMDCARINCAHDDEAAWGRMVHHLRAADGATRRTRILMDLAGPKIRTGPLLPRTAVHRLHPERDRRGRVGAPAVAHLVAQESGLSASAASAGPKLPLPGSWLAQLLPRRRARANSLARAWL
jgi:pyruvate kinase